MKLNTKNICLFVLGSCFVLLFSATCGNKENATAEAIENSDPLVIETKEDSLRRQVIEKINDYLYILPNNDSIVLGKPFIKIYEGKYDDRSVRVILSKSMENESTSPPIVTGFLYIDGDSNIQFLYPKDTNSKGVIFLYTPSDEDGYSAEYSDAGLSIQIDGQTYPLRESELRFSAYDSFIYTLKYCKEYDMLRYNYAYSFSFQAKRIPSLYQKVFESKSFNDFVMDGDKTDISKWTHHITDTIEMNLPEDDACYNYGNTNIRKPFFIDDKIVVLFNLEDSYMGGAHGTYMSDHVTYEVSTGQEINLSDILDINSPEFVAILVEEIEKQTNPDSDIDQEQATTFSSFYILPTGIHFVFPMYWFGGGAWEKDIFVSFEDLQPYLKRVLYP